MQMQIYLESCAGPSVSMRNFLLWVSKVGSGKLCVLHVGLFVYLSVVDTLPHLWEGVSDMGVLPSLRHPLLCLPVAPCLASLVPRQGSANQQGKWCVGAALRENVPQCV